MTIPRGRRAYNRVASDAVELTDAEDGGDDSAATLGTQDDTAIENEEGFMTLVIMDPAHRKFEVTVNPEWTVQDLKQHGTKVHKVPAASQRLVYMGRLLQDDDTLRDAGLMEPKTIIHLFPKPRVVVASSSVADSSGDEEDADASPEGAHIPQIVLDPDEAERRSSILVLGSSEIMEAQNNVRLLSFLLLIICSMELLALFTIMMGVPEDPNQSSEEPPEPADDEMIFPGPQEVRTWRNSDYIDLAISAFGFYVATLGIKATTENTMRLARQYLVGTVIVGIAWNCFYYYLNVEAEKEADEKRVEESDDDAFATPLPESDYYVQALFAIMLPAMLWFMCCVRAWQFHALLREAEEEAEERIRNEISEMEEGQAEAEDGDDDDDEHDETARIT